MTKQPIPKPTPDAYGPMTNLTPTEMGNLLSGEAKALKKFDDVYAKWLSIALPRYFCSVFRLEVVRAEELGHEALSDFRVSLGNASSREPRGRLEKHGRFRDYLLTSCVNAARRLLARRNKEKPDTELLETMYQEPEAYTDDDFAQDFETVLTKKVQAATSNLGGTRRRDWDIACKIDPFIGALATGGRIEAALAEPELDAKWLEEHSSELGLPSISKNTFSRIRASARELVAREFAPFFEEDEISEVDSVRKLRARLAAGTTAT